MANESKKSDFLKSDVDTCTHMSTLVTLRNGRACLGAAVWMVLEKGRKSVKNVEVNYHIGSLWVP